MSQAPNLWARSSSGPGGFDLNGGGSGQTVTNKSLQAAMTCVSGDSQWFNMGIHTLLGPSIEECLRLGGWD